MIRELFALTSPAWITLVFAGCADTITPPGGTEHAGALLEMVASARTPDGKVGICHAAGTDTQPRYVPLTVSANAASAQPRTTSTSLP